MTFLTGLMLGLGVGFLMVAATLLREVVMISKVTKSLRDINDSLRGGDE